MSDAWPPAQFSIVPPFYLAAITNVRNRGVSHRAAFHLAKLETRDSAFNCVVGGKRRRRIPAPIECTVTEFRRCIQLGSTQRWQVSAPTVAIWWSAVVRH